MELAISVGNLGFDTGLPCGLLLERFGPKWASLSAMIITGVGFFGMYLAAIYPEEFSSMFGILVVFFFIAGTS